MGAIGIALKIAGAVVLVVIGLGAYLYLTDYEAKATIVSKERDAQGDFVVVAPKIAPFYRHTQPLDSQSAQFVCEGYEVAFRVNSRELKVFDREGDLVYDTTRSPPLQVTGDVARCAVLGL